MLAGVALQLHDPHALVAVAQAHELVVAPVGGAVVDVEQLERERLAFERRERSPVELGERGALVVDRHDDRHVRGRLLGLHPARSRDDLGTGHGAKGY
jgi:hypothetical protein